MTEKQEKLEALKKELEAADLPLKGSANLVFGEGDINSAVMFVGEAPGFNEDVQKRPFVGRAGQLLDQCIKEIGWQRADVYITNIVKRRPPENRDPLPEEIEAYKPYLARQIEIIAPKVIATLGRFSMNYFLPFAKISKDHGKIFQAEGRVVFPLYHPAAALRATAVLNELRDDFKKLPAVAAGKLAVPSAADGTAAGTASPSPIKRPEKPAQARLFP
ncbi:MAG: uracil-DNA glycosylase [Candidatus Taylorbacteria bacterium]|nr:uracil-DNA glycosylase [Candidatus Taylorbacteria bacterium]